MMGREEAVVEERSQCSSGCQSGWTLYLQHSGSGHLQQCCSPPYCHPDGAQEEYYSDEEEDGEDSMVSDASSGPAPHQLSEGEELQVEGCRDMQRRRRSLGDHCSRRSGRRRSAGGFGASCSFGSARTAGSLGEVKSGTKRRAAVVQGQEKAMRQRHHGAVVVDDDDDLHDTASSSAAAPIVDVVLEARVDSGGDAMNLHPICAFLAKHSSLEWPAVRSTSMQDYATLHHS